jgi:hypothetical protein
VYKVTDIGEKIIELFLLMKNVLSWDNTDILTNDGPDGNLRFLGR